MTLSYPKREAYFAHRFIRLMTKTALAMEIGADGFALLTVIAMQEDACRYRRPVLFYNRQLCDLCGFADERPLIRLRTLLVGLGWLVYNPGGTRRPGSYHVAVPAQAQDLDDTMTAETDTGLASSLGTKSVPNHEVIEGVMMRSSCAHRGGNDEVIEGVHHTSPSPYPDPIPGEQAYERPPEQKLATWIRWTSNDAERQETNRQELRQLVEQHGMKAVQAKAEQLAHAAGAKVFPNALSDAFLAKPAGAATDFVAPALNLKPRALL